MLKFSIKLLTVRGIPLYAHWSMLLVFAYALVSMGVYGAFLMLAATASIIVHEFSHIYAAHRYGFNTESVVLHCFGGAAMINMGNASPAEEAIVAAAGPASNVALCIIAGTIAYFAGLSSQTLIALSVMMTTIAVLNGLIAILNMLPLYPLDGGRIFHAILEGPVGLSRNTSTRIALYTAVVVGAGLMVASAIFIKSLFVISVVLTAYSSLALYSYAKTGATEPVV